MRKPTIDWGVMGIFLVIALGALFWSTIIFIAAHFILKYW